MNQNDFRAVNELKMLTIDMINRSGGGYPGIALGMAPVVYALFTRVLNYDPRNPNFFNRDRVILSSSHIAALYYAMLYMAGFDIKKEDLMSYRHCGSNTPGLAEMHNPLGVEATTSYAGDGVGISVGLGLASRYIEQLILEEDSHIHLLDFTTYCFLSDADMMNGTALESFQIASLQKLSNVVFLYDANGITSEGATQDVLFEEWEKTFTLKGFYVDTLKDSTNIKEIARAILSAKNSKKPSLIIFKTIIGKDSFNEGKNIVHSGALTLDDMTSLRRKLNINLTPFEVSKDSILHIENQRKLRFDHFYNKWQNSYARAKNMNSTRLNSILEMLETGKTVIDFQADNYKINEGYRESLIDSNYKVMNLIAPKSNLFLGGSAELSLACGTNIGGSDFLTSSTPKGRNIRFGVRERAMSFILNGMSLLGLRVYGSTELCFADEMKSGIRMSAIMNLPVTYIFTHDSLYSCEDASARIPVEEIAMLRSTPNFTVYRPADIIELMGAWDSILKSCKPSALLVSKNSIPKLPGSNASLVNQGAYIIKKENERLDGIIIATGSEVVSAMQISYDLLASGLDIRVVSMPSMELFESMGIDYKSSVLPSNVKTIVIESGSSFHWTKYASNEDSILGINDFCPYGFPMEVLQKMGYDYDSLKLKVESLLKRQ